MILNLVINNCILLPRLIDRRKIGIRTKWLRRHIDFRRHEWASVFSPYSDEYRFGLKPHIQKKKKKSVKATWECWMLYHNPERRSDMVVQWFGGLASLDESSLNANDYRLFLLEPVVLSDATRVTRTSRIMHGNILPHTVVSF